MQAEHARNEYKCVSKAPEGADRANGTKSLYFSRAIVHISSVSGNNTGEHAG